MIACRIILYNAVNSSIGGLSEHPENYINKNDKDGCSVYRT